jgi:hypothetical protein
MNWDKLEEHFGVLSCHHAVYWYYEHEKYSKQIIHAPDTKGALDTIWELAG